MKRFIIAMFIAVTILGILLLITLLNKKDKEILPTVKGSSKATIAVCPTFVNHLNELDENIFTIVKTSSTGESIVLLNEGRVDYVLSGRILKPEESKYENAVLGGGFSFLSDREVFLETDKMAKLAVYTDLDTSEIIKYFELENILEVEDVYNYLDKGIVVTSWDNTDYTRAEIAHVINNDGTRNINSRIPILYFTDDSNNDLINLIKESVQNYAKR